VTYEQLEDYLRSHPTLKTCKICSGSGAVTRNGVTEECLCRYFVKWIAHSSKLGRIERALWLQNVQVPVGKENFAWISCESLRTTEVSFLFARAAGKNNLYTINRCDSSDLQDIYFGRHPYFKSLSDIKSSVVALYCMGLEPPNKLTDSIIIDFLERRSAARLPVWLYMRDTYTQLGKYVIENVQTVIHLPPRPADLATGRNFYPSVNEFCS
jgi:hypothetical protein